jgi:hypothetical protein
MCWRRERRKNNDEGGDAQEKERIGRGRVTVTVYRRNLNIQRSKLNYSHVIHPTSESSMWISKWLCFDEIFTSAVSDRPSEQRFKKSNFRSTPEPLSNIFFGVTSRLQKSIWWGWQSTDQWRQSPDWHTEEEILEPDKRPPSILLYHLSFIVRLIEGGLPTVSLSWCFGL